MCVRLKIEAIIQSYSVDNPAYTSIDIEFTLQLVYTFEAAWSVKV